MTSNTLTIEREAIASFSELRLLPETRQALEELGFETPTPIQAAALPALLAGRDVIGQARTGSGKTLAFGIPAVEAVDPRRPSVQVLILTPTRELAVQVGGVLEQLGSRRRVTTTLIYGGKPIGPQRDALRRGAHIVVGTPGRVLDLLNQGAMRLDQLRLLVLDEADEMLDRGFAPDVERIISRSTPNRQTALFSATVPQWVGETAHKHLRHPIKASVDARQEDVAPIEHVAYDIPDGDKLRALRDLLDHRGDGSIIVFGRTKHGVKKLQKQLERDGYPVLALQGNLSQNARDHVMEEFRAGRVKILLATNVAARGLDITSIDQVINVDLPESPELLTHRIGRTGRMGREGQAITLLGPEDGGKWRQLERGLGKRIPRRRWPGAAAAIAGLPEMASSNGNGNGSHEPSPSRPGQFADPSDLIPPTRLNARPTRVAASATTETAEYTGRRRPAARGSERQRERQLHIVTCSRCGEHAEVPFSPDPTRPVYCSACYQPRSRRQSA